MENFIGQAAQNFIEGLSKYYQNREVSIITLEYKKLVGKMLRDASSKPYAQVLSPLIQAESEGYGNGYISVAIATRAQQLWNKEYREQTGIELKMKGIKTSYVRKS